MLNTVRKCEAGVQPPRKDQSYKFTTTCLEFVRMNKVCKQKEQQLVGGFRKTVKEGVVGRSSFTVSRRVK